MANLMRRLLLRHGVTIALCTALLAGFQFLICTIVGTTDMSATLRRVLAVAPPIFQGLISQLLIGGGNINAALIAFGWNHPVTHALALALPITLGARAIAGERENGAIELLLAQPISRNRYLASHIVFAGLAITALAAAGTAATALGQSWFELESFPLSRLLPLLASFWLLQTTFFAITLAASAFGREAGPVAFAGVLIALVSYLLEAVATLWNRAAWLGPFSLHHYFHPRALLVEGRFTTATIVVFLSVIVLTMAAAVTRFQRSDLP